MGLKELRTGAEVEWEENGPIKAAIDPFAVGHLVGILHELMHIVLEKELAPFAEYGPKRKQEPAEIALVAWELVLSKEIFGSPRRKAWWRKAINGKLPKLRS